MWLKEPNYFTVLSNLKTLFAAIQTDLSWESLKHGSRSIDSNRRVKRESQKLNYQIIYLKSITKISKYNLVECYGHQKTYS